MSDQIKTCQGYTKSHKLCGEPVFNSTDYCEIHQYFISFTPQQYQSVVALTGVKKCGKCCGWHFDKNATCDDCLAKSRANKSAKNYSRGNCSGKTEDGKPCPKYGFNGAKVCEYHSWMKDFTDEQFANQHLYPHPDKIKCDGLTGTGNNCNHKPVSKENIYCDDHQYYHQYTPGEMNSIKNKDGKFKSCGRGHWRTTEESVCRGCKPMYDVDNAQRSAKGGQKCIVMIGDEQCERYVVDGKPVCERHLDRIDENGNIRNLYICSGCKVVRSDISGSQCYKCAEYRSKINNARRETRKETAVKCCVDGCTYNLNNTIREYIDYCGNHQVKGWYDAQIKVGKIICGNYERGCRNEMVGDDLKRRSNGKLFYTNCKECRLKNYVSDPRSTVNH